MERTTYGKNYLKFTDTIVLCRRLADILDELHSRNLKIKLTSICPDRPPGLRVVGTPVLFDNNKKG